jgi:hypothetical protein
MTILLFSAARTTLTKLPLLLHTLCLVTTLRLCAATSLSCHRCFGVSPPAVRTDEEQRVHRQVQYPDYPCPTRADMFLSIPLLADRTRYALASTLSTLATPRFPGLPLSQTHSRGYDRASRVDIWSGKAEHHSLIVEPGQSDILNWKLYLPHVWIYGCTTGS